MRLWHCPIINPGCLVVSAGGREEAAVMNSPPRDPGARPQAASSSPSTTCCIPMRRRAPPRAGADGELACAVPRMSRSRVTLAQAMKRRSRTPANEARSGAARRRRTLLSRPGCAATASGKSRSAALVVTEGGAASGRRMPARRGYFVAHLQPAAQGPRMGAELFGPEAVIGDGHHLVRERCLQTLVPPQHLLEVACARLVEMFATLASACP
jgi:hypothetical protein